MATYHTGNGKYHYKTQNSFIYCGRKFTPHMIGEHGATNITDDITKVTCKKCLKILQLLQYVKE